MDTRKLDEATIKKIMELHKQGLTPTQISRRLGVSQFTVNKYKHGNANYSSSKLSLPAWYNLNKNNPEAIQNKIQELMDNYQKRKGHLKEFTRIEIEYLEKKIIGG